MLTLDSQDSADSSVCENILRLYKDLSFYLILFNCYRDIEEWFQLISIISD